MSKLALLATILLILAGAILGGQQPGQPPPNPTPNGTLVTPTELEDLKLKVAQKDAVIAQQQAQSLHQQAALADQNAQSTLQALQKMAEDVKAAHKWGEDVTFNPNQLVFTKAPERMGDKPKPITDPALKPATETPKPKP